MRKRTAMFLGIGLVAVSASAGVNGEKVEVKLQAFGTLAEGETVSSGWASRLLATGERGVLYSASGRFATGGGVESSCCMGATGSAGPGDAQALGAEYPRVWLAEVRVLDRVTGSIRLEVTWSRQSRSARGATAETRGDTRVLTLPEGAQHVLDFVDAAAGRAQECGFVNRYVVLSAKVVEDPELARVSLGYDLWLLDRGPDGRETRLRFQAVAAQGQALEYSFEPLRLPLPGVAVKPGVAAEVTVEVRGVVRGRARRDGSIEVELGARRQIGVATAGSRANGIVGDGGEKRITVAASEAVRLPLPAAAGHVSLEGELADGSAEAVSALGIEEKEGAIRVHLPTALGRHAMSLLLTVARAR